MLSRKEMKRIGGALIVDLPSTTYFNGLELDSSSNGEESESNCQLE